MIIYIDSDFRCYTENDGTLKAVETAFFDGKCKAFIEGFRFVPEGEKWTRSDGMTFVGEMITAWKPFSELEAAQTAYVHEEYERMRLEIADMQAALATMGVTDNE